MLNIMPITTAIIPQFIYNFIISNDYISTARLQPVMLCSDPLTYDLAIILNVMLIRILVPHFVPSWHNYYITQNFIEIVL